MVQQYQFVMFGCSDYCTREHQKNNRNKVYWLSGGSPTVQLLFIWKGPVDTHTALYDILYIICISTQMKATMYQPLNTHYLKVSSRWSCTTTLAAMHLRRGRCISKNALVSWMNSLRLGRGFFWLSWPEGFLGTKNWRHVFLAKRWSDGQMGVKSWALGSQRGVYIQVSSVGYGEPPKIPWVY